MTSADSLMVVPACMRWTLLVLSAHAPIIIVVSLVYHCCYCEIWPRDSHATITTPIHILVLWTSNNNESCIDGLYLPQCSIPRRN